MVYQIEVLQCGSSVEKFDGIEARNSLEAINRIERKYKMREARLSGKNDQVKLFQWTGYEFQARSLGMTLS